jgi:hypothetical protein
MSDPQSRSQFFAGDPDHGEIRNAKSLCDLMCVLAGVEQIPQYTLDRKGQMFEAVCDIGFARGVGMASDRKSAERLAASNALRQVVVRAKRPDPVMNSISSQVVQNALPARDASKAVRFSSKADLETLQYPDCQCALADQHPCDVCAYSKCSGNSYSCQCVICGSVKDYCGELTPLLVDDQVERTVKERTVQMLAGQKSWTWGTHGMVEIVLVPRLRAWADCRD